MGSSCLYGSRRTVAPSQTRPDKSHHGTLPITEPRKQSTVMPVSFSWLFALRGQRPEKKRIKIKPEECLGPQRVFGTSQDVRGRVGACEPVEQGPPEMSDRRWSVLMGMAGVVDVLTATLYTSSKGFGPRIADKDKWPWCFAGSGHEKKG